MKYQEVVLSYYFKKILFIIYYLLDILCNSIIKIGLLLPTKLLNFHKSEKCDETLKFSKAIFEL